LLVREIDPKAFDTLNEKIIQHPNGFYSRIPVIAPLLKSEDNFKKELKKKEHLSSLSLETPGNNYLRRASQGEQGWRSGESTRLPPMWPGFDSRTRRHKWVEFMLVLFSASRVFLRVLRFSSLTKNQQTAVSISL